MAPVFKGEDGLATLAAENTLICHPGCLGLFAQVSSSRFRLGWHTNFLWRGEEALAIDTTSAMGDKERDRVQQYLCVGYSTLAQAGTQLGTPELQCQPPWWRAIPRGKLERGIDHKRGTTLHESCQFR